ncbi:MAG: L-cystine transporter, partial [Gammaproteobacteria bacterium]
MTFDVHLTANLLAAAALGYLLYRMQAAHQSFTRRVFAGLGLGVLLGIVFQLAYGAQSPTVKLT